MDNAQYDDFISLLSSFGKSKIMFLRPSCCLYVCPHPIVVGNGLLNTFPRLRIHITIEEFLHESFSGVSLSFQTKADDSFFPELLVINTQISNAMAEEVPTTLLQIISSESCSLTLTYSPFAETRQLT
jgi:hypothetical protein